MFSKRITLLAGACLVSMALQAADVVPPEIEQPGTQPDEVGNFESPDKCDNCHAGYDNLHPEYEPATGWRGSGSNTRSR